MDKLAERAGLYDLWVTLYPGFIGVIGALVWFGSFQGVRSDVLTVSQLMAYIPSELPGWVIAITASSFMGIILQEASRFMRNRLGLKDASCGLLDSEEGILSAEEISDFQKVYDEAMPEERGCTSASSRSLFHKINALAQERGIASKYVKLSIHYHMSTSLAVGMALEATALLILFIYSCTKSYCRGIVFSLIGAFTCIVLFFMFLKRSNRFNRYWVRSLLFGMKAYYHK